MNINTHITNRGKVRYCKVGGQYNPVRVLELEIRLERWGNVIMGGLGLELRNTHGLIQYH